jgi:hypothetical protein
LRQTIALQRRFRFAGTFPQVKLCLVIGTGGRLMSLARPFHFAMVCAAFVFVAAIVFGAI